MNTLYVGFDRELELPKGGYLLLDDEVRGERWSKFDPNRDSFNALANMDYRKACDLAGVMMALFPGGANTLTKEDAEPVLIKAFMEADHLEEVDIRGEDPGEKKARRMIARVLLSPVLRRVLCGKKTLDREMILARVNRAELGDFDALALGLFLIGQSKGQVVIPDFGFYGREMHVSLIREERLICGVNSLAELKKQELLSSAVLLIKEKVGSGCLFGDAETLTEYAGYEKGSRGWKDNVKTLMEQL